MENVRKLVPEDYEQKIDLYAYWKIFWRKKYYLILPLVLSFSIAFVGVRKLTPIYESFTILSIEDQNILSRTMGRYLTPVEERNRMRNQQFRAMLETRLKSRKFLELIVKDLGLHRSSDMLQLFGNAGESVSGIPREERLIRYLVSLLKKKIRIQSDTPGFFNVRVLDTDPNTAYVLADRISEKYIEVTKQEQVEGLRQAGAFSDKQLAIYKEKLEASEKELARVKREMAKTDVGSNPVNSANVHIAEARKQSMGAQIGSSNIALKRIRERLISVFGLVPSTDRISSDEIAGNLEDQIFARGEERLLVDIIGEVDMAAEDETASGLWQDYRRRIVEIVEEEYGELSAEYRPMITEYFTQRYLIDYYRYKERRLSGYIDRFRTNIERRPQLEREFNRLTHEVETNQAIYQAFIESKTSAQITEAVQSTNLGVRIGIIEKAEKPIFPVKPNRIKVIFLALVFGFACGTGAILITEYMDDSFRSVEEVQRILKVPVLGTIPKTIGHFEWEKRRRGRIILIWVLGLFIFFSIMSGALYMYARNLKSTSIGIKLSAEQIER